MTTIRVGYASCRYCDANLPLAAGSMSAAAAGEIGPIFHRMKGTQVECLLERDAIVTKAHLKHNRSSKFSRRWA